MTNLYEKKGRRYHYWGNTESHKYMGEDVMQAGQFRLVYCPTNGERRYIYDVTPDTAAFLAAAQIAQVAMENAIREKAKAAPSTDRLYTLAQQALIKKFRDDMAATGALVPSYWTHGTASEIANAGIEAVLSHAYLEPLP
jgi:hypothetical protein